MEKLVFTTSSLIEKGRITGNTILSDYRKNGYVDITYMVTSVSIFVSDIAGFSPTAGYMYKRYPRSRMDLVNNANFIERFYEDLEPDNKSFFPIWFKDRL